MTYHTTIGAGRSSHVARGAVRQGRFGRLFPNLPAWEPPGASEEAKVDVIADIAAGAFEAVGDDPAADNPSIPAGYTYFGQFIDHDVTLDTTSSLDRRNDPDSLVNFRTPRFDLDCVYGRGPAEQPYLVTIAGGRQMLTGANARGEPDLPRNDDVSAASAPRDEFAVRRTALIGDPRNDENIVVSQIQLAALGFHNARVAAGMDFTEAQRSARWHYQWVVIHDFVKRLCGEDLVDHVLGEPGGAGPNLRFYQPGERAWIPVEFSGAVYRLGHSMVRPSYHLSDRLSGFRQGRPIPIFGSSVPYGRNDDPREHLAGTRELPPFWTIQWDRFVEHEGSAPQSSRLLDTQLAPPLATLPFTAAPPRRRSLAFRNLLRGWRLGLPSGQDVSRCMGIDPVIDGHDPLWLYVLREASEASNGRLLGPAGQRILAEVFVGMLLADASSFACMSPGWQPELAGTNGRFGFADFLRHAGAPMTRQHADAVMDGERADAAE